LIRDNSPCRVTKTKEPQQDNIRRYFTARF